MELTCMLAGAGVTVAVEAVILWIASRVGKFTHDADVDMRRAVDEELNKCRTKYERRMR